MGAIKTAFDSTFRDFETDGVAASGLRKPRKREIRNLAITIEERIAAAALSGTDLEEAALVVADLTATATGAADRAEDAATSAAAAQEAAEQVLTQSSAVVAAAEAFGGVAGEIGDGAGVVVYEEGAFAVANRSEFRGDPGADLSQIGTLAELKAMDVLAAQPGATLVRVTDRPGPWRLWQEGMPALNPGYENVTWVYDGSGSAQWFYSPDQGVLLTGLGVDSSGGLDGTALLAAAQGRDIRGMGGVFKAGPINLKTQEQWEGDNAKVATPDDGATVFLVGDGVHDWRISGWQLEGHLVEAVDPDSETECGIEVRDATRGIISNMSFRNFKKAGLYRNATSFTDDGALGRGARTLGSNLAFYACAIGIKTEAHGGNEYDIYSNVHAGGCLAGADLNAGNTILVGFHLVDNYVNLRLRGGENNHLHGVLSAGTINHLAPGGTFLGHFTDIWNGLTLNAICAYANGPAGNGPIFYQRTGGINWLGGVLDAWTYLDQVGYDAEARYPYNRQEKLFMPGGYGPARILTQGTGDAYHPHMIRRDCYGPGVLDEAGVTTNDPADLYVWGSRQEAITIAAGDFLRFDEVSRIGDRRNCYNPATGIVTIPKWQDGLIEYGARFIISGVLANPQDTYFDLIRDPSSGDPRPIAPPIFPKPFQAGANLWVVDVPTTPCHYSAGDAVGLRATAIYGTDIKLGHADWPSFFWFKKIA